MQYKYNFLTISLSLLTITYPFATAMLMLHVHCAVCSVLIINIKFIYLFMYVPMPTHWIVNIMMGRFKGRGVEKHEGRCQNYYDEGFECYRNILFICLPSSIRTTYCRQWVFTYKYSKWNITVFMYYHFGALVVLYITKKVKSFMGKLLNQLVGHFTLLHLIGWSSSNINTQWKII